MQRKTFLFFNNHDALGRYSYSISWRINYWDNDSLVKIIDFWEKDTMRSSAYNIFSDSLFEHYAIEINTSSKTDS
jgi:hypothetical protein